MTAHSVVSPEQWTLARRALLKKEKALQKLRDELSQARRELPWERVEAAYEFDGAAGRETLASLFDALYAGTMTDLPGLSVFYKDADGTLFHTYSTYARGIDPFNVAYQLLDVVPKGRDETTLPHSMDWVQFNDSYAV